MNVLKVLGDTATSIAERETGLMVQLASHILDATDSILTPARYGMFYN